MLASHNPTNTLSLRAAGEYAPGLRVKWSSTPGVVELAGDEACIGVTITRTHAPGDKVTILDIRSPGTLPFTAGGAIAEGDAFTSAADGKVVTGAGGAQDYGRALSATTGDGQQFEGTPAV